MPIIFCLELNTMPDESSLSLYCIYDTKINLQLFSKKINSHAFKHKKTAKGVHFSRNEEGIRGKES